VYEFLNLLLPSVLNQLIVEYTRTQWETKAVSSWNLRTWCCGIVGDPNQQHFYICSFDCPSVNIHNLHGKIIKSLPSINYLRALEIDETELYIAHQAHITIFNLQLETFFSWKSPVNSSPRGLKLDGKNLYLTIYGYHQIFICNSQDGIVLNKWGTEKQSSNKGEFNNPTGLTVDEKYVYICDQTNNRIQVLKKEHGIFFTQWGNGQGTNYGQFFFPLCIYHVIGEELFYIGDYYSIQIFRKDGICLQRLGDKKEGKNSNQFDSVGGICVMNDLLYACDHGNRRVQVFRKYSDSLD